MPENILLHEIKTAFHVYLFLAKEEVIGISTDKNKWRTYGSLYEIGSLIDETGYKCCFVKSL